MYAHILSFFLFLHLRDKGVGPDVCMSVIFCLAVYVRRRESGRGGGGVGVR